MTKQNPFLAAVQNMALSTLPPLSGYIPSGDGDNVALLEAEINHLRDGLGPNRAEGLVMKFGERIKDLRTKKGLTLDQLAQDTGSSKSYIWELENKNPPRPSAEKLSAIAGALGVTVDYLIGSDKQTLSQAEDTAFFRQYSGLPEDTRRQIREMARILDTKTRK